MRYHTYNRKYQRKEFEIKESSVSDQVRSMAMQNLLVDKIVEPGFFKII